MNRLIIVELVAVLWVFGNVPAEYTGLCPNVTAMKNFNIIQLEGRWYRTKSFGISRITSRCATTDFIIDDVDTVIVVNSIQTKNVILNIAISGVVTTPDYVESGKISIKYSRLFPRAQNSTILGTDYETFVAMHECNEDEGIISQDAWILTEVRHPNASVIEKAEAIFRKNQVDTENVTINNQNKCNDYGVAEIKRVNGSRVVLIPKKPF